jgi:hypothetical protein
MIANSVPPEEPIPLDFCSGFTNFGIPQVRFRENSVVGWRISCYTRARVSIPTQSLGHPILAILDLAKLITFKA